MTTQEILQLPTGRTTIETVYEFGADAPTVTENYDHCLGYSYRIARVEITEQNGTIECSVTGRRLTKSGAIDGRNSYPELVINYDLDAQFIAQHLAAKAAK